LALTGDLCVAYANGRWDEWLGTPIPRGTPLRLLLERDLVAVQDQLRAVLHDGEERTLQMALRSALADAPTRTVYCHARSAADGLIVEARPEDDDDSFAMHDVAHRLAEVSDMAEVLRTLCDIATRQCGGTGAAVLRVIES